MDHETHEFLKQSGAGRVALHVPENPLFQTI